MTKSQIFENLMEPLKAKLTPESWKFLLSQGELFIEQVSKKTFFVQYNSTYAVWDKKTEHIQAFSTDEALAKFWHGKSLEGYEVNFIGVLNS